MIPLGCFGGPQKRTTLVASMNVPLKYCGELGTIIIIINYDSQLNS